MISDALTASLHAERALLGALMRDNAALDRVDFLRPSMFTGDHPAIFTAMLTMADKNSPFDAVTLSDHCSSLAYLGELMKDVLTTANIYQYAVKVRDQARARKLITTCGEIVTSADTLPIDEAVDQAQEQILGLSEVESLGPVSLRDSLLKSIDALEVRYDSKGPTGIPTGFIDLDHALCGLQDSDLIILAGRPAMGKTTFSMNIAEHASRSIPVLVFSLEMPATQLTDRMVCSVGHVDFGRYRSGQMLDEDWPAITAATSKLRDRTLQIDDQGGLTLCQIRARARKAKRRDNIGLIVIDYLQLMSGNRRTDNRNAEISEISRGLKAMAKELNVPVIALSQLNRGLEQRQNKRPCMADLRDSGAIEQDADVIMFVYRDEVYNEDSPDAGTAEIIIAKQRNGEIGTKKLSFQGKYCMFGNLA